MSNNQLSLHVAESGSMLEAVDERTNLAGSNKMEILLFSIGSNEVFGINVFKVKEVTRAVNITKTPNMPRGVDGIASLRGHVMPVLNLASFIELGKPEEQKVMMVAEYSRHVLGFLVRDVDRIVRDCSYQVTTIVIHIVCCMHLFPVHTNNSVHILH